jgi:hypothetical protein
MKKFAFHTLPITAEIYGGTVYRQVILNLNSRGGEKRVVEAENLKALQPLFEQYVADMAATGNSFYCYAAMASRNDRKPPGFDKATDRGGSLARDVNWDKAVETARAEAAAKAAA